MCKGVLVRISLTYDLDVSLTKNNMDGEAETCESTLDENPIDHNECLTLLSTHIKNQEHLKIKLKLLPQNLRYEFLDSESNHPVIVNAKLANETEKMLAVLKRYHAQIR